MGKMRKTLGIIVIMALLLMSGVPFVSQLATAAEGEDEPEEITPCEACGMESRAVPTEEVEPEEVEPEEGTSGLVSTGPVHMVLEDLVEISRAEPVEETGNLQAGWQTIMSDGFEGPWPGVWSIYAFGDVNAYWGDDSVNPYSGSWSAFCARDGSEGVIPFANYPNYMETWMDYGPFSLADATDATLDYYLWLDAESGFDAFWYLASIDGTNWYGDGWTGWSDGWVAESFDLTNVFGFGDMCGQPNVWITFGFESDISNPVDYYGAFVDDVVLQKYVPSEQFDLEAVEVYLSTEPGDTGKNFVVDTPTVGQEVYFHFKWNCVGSGTTPSFRRELRLDGPMFCYVEDPANGGSSYTTWCTSPWTATAGAHTLTGVLDVNTTVSESNETNNEAGKAWNTLGEADIWLDKTSLNFTFTETGAAVAQPAPTAGADKYGAPGAPCEACSGVGREATAAEQELLEAIRKAIEEKGAQWEANITAVSGFSLEAQERLCGLRLNPLPEDIETVTSLLGVLPSSFDWRDKDGIDWVTSVKEQICGTCWCFGTLGSLEAVINIANNDPNIDMDLSEQRILSCCPNITSRCGGIYDMTLIYDCLKLYGGTPNGACFPYGCPAAGCPETGISCDVCPDWADKAWQVNSYALVTPNTTEAYKAALIEYGPLGVSMRADDDWFFYAGGIYEPVLESEEWAETFPYGQANHWVTLVGYDDAGGYWIVKNSWSEDWGEQGYGKILYGDIEKYDLVIAITSVTGPDNCKAVTVYNEGNAILNVTDVTISYGGGEPTGWLDAERKSFTLSPHRSEGITAWVDTTGLSPGEYHATLNIYSNDPDENPTIVPVALTVGVANNPPNAPASPLCEGETNPTGVTDPTPEFSWTFSDPDGGDTQGAYQILVASTPGNLASDNGDMWDSTKVSGDASVVSYAGTTLAENQTYYWKVKTWDNNDAEGTYCGEQQFTTGTSPSEVWVDDDFDASTSGWGVTHFATIQEGINAVEGSTVHVAAGYYTENITLVDGVEVLGAGAEVTTIDGDASGSVVTADGVGATTVLDGFTITNGDAYGGGGMYNFNSSSPTVTNCTFSVNSASHGGGMFNDNSSPTVTDCTFSGNSASGHGGGMCNNNSSPEVSNCTFSANSASLGGGMCNSDSSPTLTNCTFSGNSATDRGGGMYTQNNSSPTVTNCIFSGNSASSSGGGMYNSINVDNSSPTVTNCTFSGNSAVTHGGGMYNLNNSPVVTNCILWGNGEEIYNASSTPTVNYCDVEGGYSGTGNIDADPLFVGGGDYHLQAGSPCIDTGDNMAVSGWLTTDFEGDPRILDGDGDTVAVVDMGVDEYVPLPNTPPEVSNVIASQGSPIVDITYDVSDAEQSEVSISFEYWDGASWWACTTTTGEGTQSTGTGKSGTWNAKTDRDEHYMTDCKIRVIADDGQAENNIFVAQSNTFTLDTKDPTGYGCSSPSNGATDVSINPDLTCLTASDDSSPISYYFQLAENDTFSLGLQESGWQSNTTWSPSTLAYNEQYFWRVKAKDNYANETDYSPTFNFTTEAVPSGPGLLRVETSPAVPTTILVDGIPRNAWGLDWVKMPPGEYTLSFTDTPGHLAPDEIEVTYDPPGGDPVTQPLSEPIEILPDTTTVVTVPFVPLGNLWVRTDPAVPTIISLNDSPPANNWGFWVDLLPGDYALSFTDVVGFNTPAEVEVTYPGESPVTQPISEPIAVSAGGTTQVVIHFILLGNLKVETSPVLEATIFVDGNPMNDWGFWLNLEAGDYTVSFEDMQGYTTPPPTVVTVTAGVTTYVTGDYDSGTTIVNQ